MFDFAWSEIALIGVVALVLIGPKDMPVAIKAVAGVVKKARRMASEFQSHVDEMVRDTELAEVRNQINEIRNFDIRGEFERTVDADGSLRKAFEDPLATATPGGDSADVSDTGSGEAITAGSDWTTDTPAEAAEAPPAPALDAPAFIPPAIVAVQQAPAFIPPLAAQGSHARPPFA